MSVPEWGFYFNTNAGYEQTPGINYDRYQDKWVFAPLEGGYLEIVTFFNRLWKENLMDPEFFTTSSKMATENMEKEVKTFPAVVNGKHVMDIKFQYLGNKPMDPTTQIKGIPPGEMKNAHFYYYEMVNLTDHTMEIFAYHSTGRMISVDESGMRKTSPPRWLNREELVRTWGLKSMRIETRGRKIVRDTWLYCSQPPCKIVNTYKIRILETNEVFSIKIVKKG